MVRECRAGFGDGVENAVMVFLERFQIRRLDDEDEVQIRALRIAVRDVRRAHRVRPCFDRLSHVEVHLRHIVPVDRAFQRVDDDTVVLDGVAEVRIGESAVLPRGSDVTCERHGVVLVRDLADVLHDVALQAVLAVREAEQQAAPVGLEALRGEKRIERRLRDAVHVHHHIRLLRVGEPEHGRIAELALHYLAHRRHAVLPCREHIREFAVFSGLFEHFKRHLRQNAVRPFAAHHDLVDVGTGGFSRRGIGAYPAYRGDVLLAQHEIRGAAVVGGVLTAAARHYPAAHTAVLEGLREVPAGEAVFRAEVFGRVVEDVLKLRSADAGLDGDGLVDLVEGDDFVEILPEVEDHVRRAHALRAARDAGPSGIDVKVYLVLLGESDQLLHVLRGGRIDDDVGKILDDALPQAHDVHHGLAVAHLRAGPLVGGDVVLSHDGAELVYLLYGKAGGHMDVHHFVADVHHLLKVVVGEVELLFHQLVKPLFRALVCRGIAPFHDGAVTLFDGRIGDPFRFELFVGFV